MGVYLEEVLLGVGVEHSKKKAEQLAAKEALEKMAVWLIEVWRWIIPRFLLYYNFRIL